MENNFESIIDMFLFEANTLLEQLDDILLRVEDAKEFTSDDINEIFRAMHTIKGSAAMMQFAGIMTISHKIEDLFYYIRENGVDSQFTDDLVTMVFKCTDFIKGEIVKISDNTPLTENISEYEKEILELLDIVSGKKSKSDRIEDIREEIKNISVQTKEADDTNLMGNTFCVNLHFDDDCGMENLRAFMLVNQIKEIVQDITYEPENVETDSDTIKMIVENGFKVFFANKTDLNLGVDVIKSAVNIKDFTIIEQSGGAENNNNVIEEESVIQTETVPSIDYVQPKQDEVQENVQTTIKQTKQSLISVNLTKLDKLSDIVGEIVITESMVNSNKDIIELKSDSFTKATRQLRKLTDELQDIVMSLRMVPVSGVFQKMKRIVRDMSKSLGKDVDLVLIGDDIEVDKTIVDGISDPLMHVVRNSMDHGIESKEDRIKKGKNPKGTIKLTASNTGGEILITVEDDGKGLDPQYILTKAKSKNLLQKPESEYTLKEIFSIAMLPGFSTKEAVTEFSGRGVGMDVVKKNIENVGGNIVLDSKVGTGTTVTFKIPLTLAIVDGMQIVVGGTEFIIPIKNIQQSLNVNLKDVVKNTDGSEGIMLRNKCYPIIRLHEVFNIQTEINELVDGIIVLVEIEDKSFGLFADSLLGEQQVVVKPLPVLLNKFNIKGRGISGCSMLGDGSISLILDALTVYDNAMEGNYGKY